MTPISNHRLTTDTIAQYMGPLDALALALAALITLWQTL